MKTTGTCMPLQNSRCFDARGPRGVITYHSKCCIAMVYQSDIFDTIRAMKKAWQIPVMTVRGFDSTATNYF